MEKEFTLKDVTDAMHSGAKIVDKGWINRRYIHFIDGFWMDNDGDIYRYMDFSDLSKWKYFEEPQKKEKRTFYRAYVHDPVSDTIVPYPVMFSTKDEAIKDVKVGNIVDWKSKEFEIPVEENK